MHQNMFLLLVMLATVLTVTGGETILNGEVLDTPPSDVAGQQLHNGPVYCGEDMRFYPYLCNSSATPAECKKNPILRQSCNFSCSLSGQLWRAAWRGSLSEVKTAIASGANPLCQHTIPRKSFSDLTMYDRTSIHVAALANQQWVIKALLDFGVDVNLQTAEGKTPTYDASWNGSVDALNTLIANAANINLPTSQGVTPLIAAAGQGQLSTAKVLINANASLDVTGGWPNATALYHAVRLNNHDLALFFIEHNANVNLCASNGETPLIMAARQGHLSIAKALINANASIDITDRVWEGTALHWAVSRNNQDVALLLIEHNANVNIPDAGGNTPLMRAAEQGLLNVTRHSSTQMPVLM